MKPKYYNIENLINKYPDASYYIAMGIRSAGKTYSACLYGLKRYFETGEKFIYLRRWWDDFKNNTAATLFNGHVSNGVIEELSGGTWTGVKFYNGAWYFTAQDSKHPEQTIKADQPFCYAMSLTRMEHLKSSSFTDCKTVIFDEVAASSSFYLPDEFTLFMNTLSTVIRNGTDVKIFLLMNTITYTCPYYQEMGLTKIKDLKPGDVQEYTYGESPLKVVVELTDTASRTKEMNKYWAFNNPKLNMICGVGDTVWQLDIYPHLNGIKILPENIKKSFFIEFQNELFQGDITKVDKSLVIYFHRKTTPIKNPDKDIIYGTKYDPVRKNYSRDITRPIYPVQEKIYNLIKDQKVIFQDNTVGDLVTGYINWCKTNN